MPSVGPITFSAGSDDAGVGTFAWASTSNVTADDGSYAAASNLSAATSHYLFAQNVSSGLSAIPDGANVTNVELIIERSQSGFGADVTDSTVKMIVAGSVSGDNKAAAGAWPGSDTQKSYSYAPGAGGWNVGTLTGAQVKATNWGFALSVALGDFSITGNVDYMSATVTYTVPTRLYLPKSALSSAISPTPDAAWEDTSILVRSKCSTTKLGDAISNVIFSDSDDTDKDILYQQWISAPLTAGQTITGSQTITACCRVREDLGTNNLFFTLGIRVLASDGSTVRKTVLAVTRDDVEAPTTIASRYYSGTSAATDYTTVSGDRLVIEFGMGGDPDAASTHDSRMSFGDSGASDLDASDGDTGTDNPWVELSDTLTFTADSSMPVFMHHYMQQGIA